MKIDIERVSAAPWRWRCTPSSLFVARLQYSNRVSYPADGRECSQGRAPSMARYRHCLRLSHVRFQWTLLPLTARRQIAKISVGTYGRNIHRFPVSVTLHPRPRGGRRIRPANERPKKAKSGDERPHLFHGPRSVDALERMCARPELAGTIEFWSTFSIRWSECLAGEGECRDGRSLARI